MQLRYAMTGVAVVLSLAGCQRTAYDNASYSSPAPLTGAACSFRPGRTASATGRRLAVSRRSDGRACGSGPAGCHGVQCA